MAEKKDKSKKTLRKVSGNWGRFTGIFMKFFKTSVRDKPLYFWVFGYPLIFMILIGMGAGSSETTYNIAIINYDSQTYGIQTENDVVDASSMFLIGLFNSSDTNFTSFNAVYGSTLEEESNSINLTLKGELDAVVILSANFSENLLGFESGVPYFFVWTRPDPIKKAVIPSVFKSIVDSMIMMYEGIDSVEFSQEDAVPAISTSFVDFLMPALVIAGITVAIMNVASLFATEKQKGLMRRLDTTPVPRSIVFLGGAAAQITFSAVQSIILLLCTTIFGTQFAPNANWFLAFLVTILTAFMCIGIGLIIAAIVKDADAAGGLSWVAILPLQFLSGTFGMAPTDGIPTTYSVRAMQKILISGLGWADVWLDILGIVLYGILFFTIGLAIFEKKSQV